MKLTKNQKVVITCTDSRKSFKPTVATVITSGKKWVTVQLDNTNYTFPYYFKAEVDTHDYLRGGNKDGSYQIYQLYDYPSIEEYEYQMKLRDTKFEIVTEIKTILSLYKYKLSIDYLTNLRNELKQSR